MYIEEKIIVPTNDFVFKRIFGYPGSEKITKRLLELIIEDDIESIDLGNSTILEKDLRDEKVGILDILAKGKDNTKYNIEMQMISKENIQDRMLFYWSKVFLRGIKEGNQYDELNKVVSILIANFKLKNIKEIPEFHTKWQIREETYSNTVLTSKLEIHIIELPKLIEMIENGLVSKKDELVIWLRFIMNPEELSMEEIDYTDEIKEAERILRDINSNEHDIWLAEQRLKYIRDQYAERKYARKEGYEEGHEEGYKEGHKKGHKEGNKEAMIKVARKMIQKEIPINEIIELTGLTKEEIENI